MPMKTWKPALCLLLVLAICCSVTVGVAAATYTDASGTYQHTKISHEETPVKSVDGIVDYIGDGVVSAADEGQGDRGGRAIPGQLLPTGMTCMSLPATTPWEIHSP